MERSSPCFLRSCFFAFSVMVQFALVIPAARFCRATDLSPPREYRRSFAHKTHVWHASFIRATCTTSAFPATSAYNTNPLNLQAMSMPTQPNLKLTNAPTYRENYANSVQVRVNVWDFFLVFGTLQQHSETEVEITNFQGVYVSPQQAKALLAILQQNIVQYENAFGEIKLDPRMNTTGPIH